MRPKRRVEFQRHMRRLVVVGCAAGIFLGVGKALMHQSSWFGSMIKRHTPLLEIKAPEILAESPLLREDRPAGISWWLPKSGWQLRKRWLETYPTVSDIRFEKRFFENRVIAHVIPRVPLVRYGNQGVDKEGVVFDLVTPERWGVLPKAVLKSPEALSPLGPFLQEVSRDSQMWKKVVAVSEDMRGDVWLNMNTGTHVAWGRPDPKDVAAKAQCLTRVLNDAHERLSGAAMADLRFFNEGRVVIRPKTAI